jgi:hypothetical protein
MESNANINRIGSEMDTFSLGGESQYIEACKKVGFIELNWQENVIDPITGQNSDRAEIRGNRFSIYITIAHPKPSVSETLKKFNHIRDFSVSISFNYHTELGTLTYFLDRKEHPLEKAKEYALWQATLLYKLLSKLDEDDFGLNIFERNDVRK